METGTSLTFKKSSVSYHGGDRCVEVAFEEGAVHVRNSKQTSTVITFSPEEWEAFIAGIRKDEFDLPVGV